MNVGLVIFDFDGVVADSEVLSLGALREALAECGLDWPLEDVRSRFLGASLKTIAGFVAQHAPQGDAGFAETWQNKLFAGFRRGLAPMPGVLEALARLRDHDIAYCIASSSSFERLGVALEAMGLSDEFAYVFSAEQVAHGKPAPDLFLYAANRLKVAPRACLVIEDSPYGVQAARAAGMRAFGLVAGRHLRGLEAAHRALLQDSGAERVLNAFSELFCDGHEAGRGENHRGSRGAS